MLNEDRIKVMTGLAVFEKEHGKENEIASRYYKGDYISYHMIWTAIMSTIAFGLGLLLFFGLNFETYMEKMHTMNLLEQGKNIVVLYVVFLVVMLTIAYFWYRNRYRRAKKGLQVYCDKLHDLEKIYNSEIHREHSRPKQED